MQKNGVEMRKYTENKLKEEMLNLKQEKFDLENKIDKTEFDKKRLKEINDLLYQIENVLRWSGK